MEGVTFTFPYLYFALLCFYTKYCSVGEVDLEITIAYTKIELIAISLFHSPVFTDYIHKPPIEHPTYPLMIGVSE